MQKEFNTPARLRKFEASRVPMHSDPVLQKLGVNQTFIKRFWSKVDKNGPTPKHRPELGPCWIWTGGRVSDGYGRIKSGGVKRRDIVAAKASMVIHNIPIPDGLCALHKCDNPPCVNPDHLFAGTHADNQRDMMAKGRKVTIRGENHYMTKFSLLQIEEIKSCPWAVTEVAKIYGVHKSTISRIRSGKSWNPTKV